MPLMDIRISISEIHHKIIMPLILEPATCLYHHMISLYIELIY